MAVAYLCVLVFSTLISFITSTTYNFNNDNGIKSMHFSLYQHNAFNKTDFMILNGIGGPGLSATSGPLGSIFVVKDPLTSTTSVLSEQLGTIEMVVVTHTIEGSGGIAVNKVNLNLKNGPKGSISVVGVYDYQRSSDMPVSGGTGDFLFVQGYVSLSAVSYHGINAVIKNEFYLYWPPYAPYQRQS